MVGLVGGMFLSILFLILLINMDQKLNHIYRYPGRALKTTKLFHSPDVRHLTIGALLCGRQVWTVVAV